ncbi:arginine repressor [Streptococcus jiangjianxini]|uniref:arginine repressor n=1 Tax=Streptococcus jiangjianxini TaxID=3161189 RepID=UPI0032EB7D52
MRKNERLELIRKIVTEQEIETQQELVTILESKGVTATQATVSRDINSIGIIKVKGNRGGYVYGLSNEAAKRYMSPLQRAAEENILTVTLGQSEIADMINIVVVPGSTKYLKRLILEDYADQIFSLIGDDDSLLLIATTEENARELAGTFRSWIRKK